MKSKKYIIRLLLLSFAAVIITAEAVSAQQAYVICNKNVPQDSLSASDIKQIFLGRKTRWSNDQAVDFVTLKEGDVHDEFLKNFISKTPSQFQVFWKKKLFSGQGKALKSFNTPEEILNYVAGTPGAIGYIPGNLPKDSVRVVASIPVN